MIGIVKSINNFKAFTRLLISFSLAIVGFIIAVWSHIAILTGITLAWDIFCIVLIMLNWVSFFTIEESGIYKQAQRQDESRSLIFILVLLSICISLGGLLFLMKNNDANLVSKEVHRAVSLSGVALSWMLLHTIFILHYAHLYYYKDGSVNSEKDICGLHFPKEDTPDYLDFAYFSFVVGMTFQVSDVEVNTKKMRRLVLLHGLISFVFNTIIVALTISIISGPGK